MGDQISAFLLPAQLFPLPHAVSNELLSSFAQLSLGLGLHGRAQPVSWAASWELSELSEHQPTAVSQLDGCVARLR